MSAKPKRASGWRCIFKGPLVPSCLVLWWAAAPSTATTMTDYAGRLHDGGSRRQGALTSFFNDAKAPIHLSVLALAATRLDEGSAAGQSVGEASPAPVGVTNKSPSRTIGIEGSFSMELPRPDYRPRPLDDRTEMILRIDAITPTNGQYRYDFYYMGLEPGGYQLADYLIRPDGSRPNELEKVPLVVRSLLPEDHDGQLNPFTPNRFPFIGGYRVFLGVIGLVWAGGIAAFVISFRKRKVVVGPAVVITAPSLADLMRPLVEAAAAGKLTTEGQAQLERLLMGYWREKLRLPADLRMAEAVAQLKAHTQAGELLRRLERWLHRPGGISAAEVNSLLEPYRLAAAPGPTGTELSESHA